MDSRAVFSSEVTGHQQNAYFEALGSHLLLAIANYLTFSEAYTWFVTNKALYTVYESDDFWKQKFGAYDRIDFICRFIVLHKELQTSIIAATIKITEGEVTQHYLALSPNERVPYFISQEENISILNQAAFVSDERFIIALREGLVTLNQVLHNSRYRKFFALDDGLHLLRDKRLREWLLQHDIVICQNGLTALRDKLLSPAQIEQLHNKFSSSHLAALLSDNGLLALREGLITVEQVLGFPYDQRLNDLLSDEGIEALRLKKITPEWVAELPCVYMELRNILEEVASEQLKALVKDRLGDGFSYRGTYFVVDQLNRTTYRSNIIAYFRQEHPAVKAACEKLNQYDLFTTIKEECGLYTEIKIRHSAKNQLKEVLKAMPKVQPLPPQSAEPIGYLDNKISGLSQFSFFMTPLDGMNLSVLPEEMTRSTDETISDLISKIERNQPA